MLFKDADSKPTRLEKNLLASLLQRDGSLDKKNQKSSNTWTIFLIMGFLVFFLYEIRVLYSMYWK